MLKNTIIMAMALSCTTAFAVRNPNPPNKSGASSPRTFDCGSLGLKNSSEQSSEKYVVILNGRDAGVLKEVSGQEEKKRDLSLQSSEASARKFQAGDYTVTTEYDAATKETKVKVEKTANTDWSVTCKLIK